MAGIAAVTDADFAAQVEKTPGFVMVDFWAEWCGPCQMLTPILEDLAKDLAGRVKVLKYNIDENAEVATRFGVRGVPTLLFFKDGALVHSQVGATAKSRLRAQIDKLLG